MTPKLDGPGGEEATSQPWREKNHAITISSVSRNGPPPQAYTQPDEQYYGRVLIIKMYSP